jgi:hypothetical protein
VLARAQAELTPSVLMTDDDAPPPAAAAARSGPMLQDSGRMSELARSPLSAAAATELEALCRSAADYSAFSSFVRHGLGSLDTLSRSFVVAVDVPDLDLGGCAVDKADDAEDRRAEKRVRVLSPAVRIPASAAGLSAPAPKMVTDSSDDDVDDAVPPLIPVSAAHAAASVASAPAASASAGSSAASGSASAATLDVAPPPLLGFGRSVRLGGLLTPALAGAAAATPGSPSSPFAGLPRCDIDIADAFTAFAVIQVGIWYHGAVPCDFYAFYASRVLHKSRTS